MASPVKVISNSLSFHGKLLIYIALCVVVGTVEGGRAPTKIKTDLKKPIVNVACHPRLPVLVNAVLIDSISFYIFLPAVHISSH